MSRIGNRILTVPAGVTVSVDGNKVTVKGPKGELSTEVNKNIKVDVNENEVKITRTSDEYKNFHGTANANIKNMIDGVTHGFEKSLESVGVGYRFQLKGKVLVVTAGFSHPVEVEIPEGITVTIDKEEKLTITGIDKQKVGEFSAQIRKLRAPEPYKGKGIRYDNEVIRRKVGKTGVK